MPKLTPEQFRDITRYRYLGGVRPKNVPHITVANLGRTEYLRITTRWKRFDPWNRWQDEGKPAPRPDDVWKAVPQWDGIYTPWDLRKEIVSKRAKPPTPQPPHPVPPVEDVSFGMSWIVMGENAQKAMWYPPYYGVMFTADIGVNENGQKNYPWPTKEQIAWHKARGQRTAAWCDCHSTFPDDAKKMMRDLGLDTWCGEGESASAFQNALDAHVKLCIVNLTALTGDQKEEAEELMILLSNELYLNQDESRAARENWENLRNVCARLDACYDAAGEAPGGHRKAFRSYLDAGKFQAHRDWFYDPGATDEDRRLVP